MMIKAVSATILFGGVFLFTLLFPGTASSQTCLPGCCGSICGGCPGAQTCSIGNGACPDGLSCDSTAGVTCQYPEYCWTGAGQLGQHACTGTVQVNDQNQQVCVYDPAVPTNCTSCTPFGNPSTPDNTGYTCTPYDIGPIPLDPITGLPTGPAPQCSCSDHYYCSGSVWSSESDVMADNACDSPRRTLDCNELEDYFCANGPDGVDCYKHYKTSVQMSSTSPTLGDSVNITVYGSKSCADDHPTMSVPNGLVLPTDYNTYGCQATNASCDPGAIGDRACQWNYSCTANNLTSNTASFTTDALMIDPHIGNCSSSQSFTIVPQALCNASQPPVNFTDFDTGDFLLNPWYNDEAARKEAYLGAWLPTEVNADIKRMLTPTPGVGGTSSVYALLPPIGVDTGIMNHLICYLAGQFQVFQGLLAALGQGNFCPVPVNLVDYKTNYEVVASRAVSGAERPMQIQPTPAPKSCHLAEDPVSIGEGGNTKLNKLDVDWASQGIYGISMPQISITPRPTTALVVNDQVLVDDKRVNDMEGAESVGYQGWYPVSHGIFPLNDPKY